MDRNSNFYTFLFVGVMIVGIASILAYTSQTLKPMQDENVKNEKMQNILSTVGINVSRDEAEKFYKKYIIEELALTIDGSVNNKIRPFSDFNLAKELKKDYKDQHFPLYIADIDSEKYYIIELRGPGLWDAIWGYISLKSDFNTVNGVSFDHKGVTMQNYKMKKKKSKNKPLLLFFGKNSEPIFSKKNKKLLSDPLDDNNPITVQVLGICSALAITVQLKPAIVMTMSVIFVMACSNVIISILRNLIPNRIRIIVFLVVISSLVALVDQFLKAYAYDVSKELSIFIGLIVTNCIVMGRLEAFALGNDVWKSFLDGIGNAFGYGVILILVAFFRELLGSGNLMGFQVIPDFIYDMGYENNGLMLLSPMALITVGIIIWIQRSRNNKLIEEG